jgi:hypothetical protein
VAVARDGRLLVTIRARMAIRAQVRRAGPQHLRLTWPGGITTLPAAVHGPGPHDVILGHVARCPIYVDVRQLALFRERRVLVDACDPVRPDASPILKVVVAAATSPRRRPVSAVLTAV